MIIYNNAKSNIIDFFCVFHIYYDVENTLLNYYRWNFLISRQGLDYCRKIKQRYQFIPTGIRFFCWYNLIPGGIVSQMDSTFPSGVHLSDYFISLSLNCDFCDLFDEDDWERKSSLNHKNQINHSSNKNTSPYPSLLGGER